MHKSVAGRDPLARMTQVRRSEHPVYYKAVLRLAGQLDPHLTVLQGYHGVKDSLGRVLPTMILSDLPLMHLPVRSAGQLIAKGVIGWLANAARDPASSSQSQSYQKRRIHDRVVTGMQSLSPEELCEEALIYAQEPGGPGWEANAVPAVHGIDMTRRCSDGNFAEPTALIAAAKAGDPMVSQTFTLPAPRNAAAEHTGIEMPLPGPGGGNSWSWMRRRCVPSWKNTTPPAFWTSAAATVPRCMSSGPAG